ncbi:MAG: hypothetical protein ACYDEX_25245 [Mobilitalea sp.]
MAKCKLCKTNIPDGIEYCNDCQDKGITNSNESYLDSLLNSVKNSVPPIESIYKNRKNTVIDNIEDTDKTKEADIDEFETYTVDLNDIEDFEQFNLDDDLDNLENNIVIDDEELFGEKLSNIFEDDEYKDQEHYEMKDEITELVIESQVQDQQSDELINETDANSSNQIELEKNNNEDTIPDISQNNIIPNEILDFQETNSIDTDLNDLLNSLDSSNNDIKEETITGEDHFSLEDGIEPANLDDYEQMDDEEEDDFLSLLNQISSDDPVSADVMAINDLLNGGSVEPQRKSSTPSDVGDVFSDALKVVSSLNDPDLDEIDLLNKIPDRKKKNKKNKTDNKDNIEEQDVANPKTKSKISLVKRLFGNVEDENAKKKGKSLKDYKSEESAATKDTTKKGKSKKKKKGAAAPESDDSLEEGRPGKVRPGEEAPTSKKDKKKDKSDKKKKTKEIIQVIDEIEEDEGRINRLGAFIVFLFFGLLVLLLLVGTNVLSYTLSIQNATNYFDKQKYTQAYNEVYGIEIKDEDIEIYDKIMTVMFVNKQLNSYNSYYSMEKYPEALDSLLKGLSRYEKYIELATMLGIKTDLDYVRSQILAELNNEFNLTEIEALKLIDYENMEEYSLKVYDVVLEQMNN